MEKNRRPILVTGSHRSGTTWVGKMIGLSKDVHYIYEPFGIDSHYKVFNNKEFLWFLFINEKNENEFYNNIKYIIECNLSGIKYTRTRKQEIINSIIYLKYCLNFLKASAGNKIPIIKDPYAIYSAEWLSITFETRNIVMIRHPLAFVGSIKKFGWRHPFKDFIMQPSLINQYCSQYKDQIEKYSIIKTDIVDEAILLWNIIYSAIIYYQKEHPEWLFIKHERISREPRISFRKIYEYLGLDYTKKIDQTIYKYTCDKNPGEVDAGNFKVNSVANVYNWKYRLEQSEIERVIAGTRDVAKFFYDDEMFTN